MSEQGQPTPQRIGDAERDRAADLLREHMAQGRLTAEEFDERIEAALSAKVTSDLDPLFSDLPGPRPGQAVATTGPPDVPPPHGSVAAASAAGSPTSSRNRALATLTAVMWPATILLISAIGWGHFWWLVFVPIMISSLFGKNEHDRRDRDREQERQRIERQQRRLDERRRAIEE